MTDRKFHQKVKEWAESYVKKWKWAMISKTHIMGRDISEMRKWSVSSLRHFAECHKERWQKRREHPRRWEDDQACVTHDECEEERQDKVACNTANGNEVLLNCLLPRWANSSRRERGCYPTRLQKISRVEMQSLLFWKRFLSMLAGRMNLRWVGGTGHDAAERGAIHVVVFWH
jgi:hypothetical protein